MPRFWQTEIDMPQMQHTIYQTVCSIGINVISMLMCDRDLAQRHVQKCYTRGSEIILPMLQRGKKRLSCDRCSRRKVSCDARASCMRCRSASIECTYKRYVMLQSEETDLNSFNGFEKHAGEYWWLARTLLKVEQSGDRSCRYMHLTPSDSGKDLHHFIGKYRNFTG